MKKTFKIFKTMLFAVVLLASSTLFISCKKKAISVEQIITFNGSSNFVFFELDKDQLEINKDGGVIIVFLNYVEFNVWNQAPFLDGQNVQFNVVDHKNFYEINARNINDNWWDYPFEGPRTYNMRVVAIPAETKLKMDQEKFDYKTASYEQLTAKL